MQASPTSSTTNANSISYSPISLCKTFISMRSSPTTVEFYLYDEHKEMSLRDFCRVCLIPFEGSVEEPHHDDVEGFIDTIVVEDPKKGSDARISSIHFPVLRYFSTFASRCLIGHGNSGNFNVPNIIILLHALFSDNSFSMGVIIAKRLSLNRTKGPIFGGIYAARLAKHFELPLGTMRKRRQNCILTF